MHSRQQVPIHKGLVRFLLGCRPCAMSLVSHVNLSVRLKPKFLVPGLRFVKSIMPRKSLGSYRVVKVHFKVGEERVVSSVELDCVKRNM